MKLINKIKKYFAMDENTQNELSTSDTAAKWKALALEINTELQGLKRQYNYAMNEVVRLQRICECQSELLAEKGAGDAKANI